jgi:hypothetical protein
VNVSEFLCLSTSNRRNYTIPKVLKVHHQNFYTEDLCAKCENYEYILNGFVDGICECKLFVLFIDLTRSNYHLSGWNGTCGSLIPTNYSN